jgi:hypothetical protein
VPEGSLPASGLTLSLPARFNAAARVRTLCRRIPHWAGLKRGLSARLCYTSRFSPCEPERHFQP